MNVGDIKEKISKAFNHIRGIPLSNDEYEELKEYFNNLLKPWENCINEKCDIKPDKRQERFRTLISFLDEEFKEKSSLGNSFFKASYVNIGWLKDTIEELLKKQEIRTISEIQDYLTSCVQRLNNFRFQEEFDKKYNFVGYYITFTTRDDYGEYGYGFFVKTKIVLKEK